MNDLTAPAGHRLLRALAREPVDRTPVWLMRQAGRYLPEYREMRAQAGSFKKLCTTPDLACEVTLQPLRRFPLDAAIVFSDILTIPDAMGLGLQFVEGEGPRFERPVRSGADIRALHVPDPEAELGYVMQTLRLVRSELDDKVPLIGFSGSPWTLATYMVEGGASSQFQIVKALLYEHREDTDRLLQLLARSVIDYLQAQIDAGAQAVMIFDTWGGALAADEYRELGIGGLTQIVQALKAKSDTPVVIFSKGANGWLEALAASGCDALGLDWTIGLDEARQRVGDLVALQGNLDPCVLYASPATIRAKVARTLAQYGNGPGHVFNLGHGLQPGMQPDHVAACIEAVHDLSPVYHRADAAPVGR